MGRNYSFPAKRDDIDKCNDVNQLRKWEHQFELTIGQMESDFGSIENVPEKLFKYARANQMNLKQIKFKIRKLTGPVTSAGALKAFHDIVRQCLPNEYEALVNQTKSFLGRPDDDWNELIKYRKK